MLLDSGCVVCGQTAGPVCVACRDGLRPAGQLVVPGLDRCRVGFSLDDYSRPIIAAFKYRRQRRIARWLAIELSHLVPRGADLITWVPATPERRQMRGFDQAQELARALSNLTEVPTARLLRRDRHDHRQTGRSRDERLAGPALRSIRPGPAFIVIVDDVVTTGSSLRAAATAIRSGTNQAVDHVRTQRIVGVAMAATPAYRDPQRVAGREQCLHDLTNASSIREWT